MTPQGVSVAVFRHGKVLLARRAKAPFTGCWSLPGGALEKDETPPAAAMRELAEETGLSARRLHLVGTYKVPLEGPADRAGLAIAVYACTHFSGSPVAGDDATELTWCELDALARFRLTPGTAAVIRNARDAVDTRM